ncbi:MAG: GMC oxidoreductase [Candidatus Hodarchaeota archaeon]
MEKVIIVGSGASGVHFAQSLLQKKYQVIMLDVGYKRTEMLNPDNSFADLKYNLNDPVEYFLGKNFESVIYPDNESEYYGFPPNKNYVFQKPKQFSYQSSGFSPLFSFARGGLAEVWTGGVYPLNDGELSDFPFSYRDILPYYNESARRIGVSGAKDDLSSFLPFHDNIMEPLSLDEHSALILSKYKEKKFYLNKKLKCYLGRSRIATLSEDLDKRKVCTYSGRCLWGCPSGALYTPSMTLKACINHPNFKYIPNMYITHFQFNSKRRITHVMANYLKNGQQQIFSLDKLVLAAGTLATSKIFLESIFKNTGEIIRLNGLMDNRQVLVPFVNLKMAGKPYHPESYQYHQIAMGFESENPKEYIHGQLTTLKSALIHPIIQNIPFDLKSSIFVFRNLHSALGVINLNFSDFRRDTNYVTLVKEKNVSNPKLLINYEPMINESGFLKKTIKTLKKAILKLGCVVPPGMVYIRPMGASVHYSGTIPMTRSCTQFTTSENCQSHDFENLFIVDGTTFPFLPAKNLTFSLMANAIRIADNAF